MAIAAIILLTACGSGSGGYDDPDYAYEPDEELCIVETDRISELEEQLEEARAQLAVLEDRKNQLQSAAEDLQADVERLSFENWRDVVPDIDASADYVEDEASQMESDLSEAESILGER
ncbi:hypothetical protein [Luteimonas sp. MC1828]|uniref:hypothetical protein n=1 Tax=Luteimonas sp. MC1828 TaxID=2799787 RepID=UPI0018F12DC2|nr:hypothetical protein [Luteimonas sp. MC1828]MBJ7575449.1 hypothetical protein [Luteimonas sp. MC1828]